MIFCYGEQYIALVWREILASNFSVLGRLACLAACVDKSTGHYGHIELSRKIGRKEADYALRLTHELIWQNWINGSPEQQHVDVFLYLHELSQVVDLFIHLLLASQPIEMLPPKSASDVERALFTKNLRLIVTVLQHQHGSESRHNLRPFEKDIPRIVDYVASAVAEQYANPDLSLKLLSQKTGMCPEYLGRRFKHFTGKTFHLYLREIRMRNAARLLKSSSYAIKLIAGMVGYSDRSRFGEHFRTTNGCTPLHFRQRHGTFQVDVVSSDSKQSL